MAQQNDVNIKIQVDTTQAQSSTDSYKKRLKELKDEMTQLQVETDGLSKASAEQRQRFAELSQEAGKIQDAMSDTAQQVKNLSDDYLGMTAALQGVQAGVGAITAVSGALSAFGIENEKANETIKRMTSLMSILQGVQAVSKALNKDSALMTALRAKSEKSLNKELVKTTQAETAGTAATATFTAAEGAATTGAITLKGAVKAVGTAIKSIPVVGWILAAIAAITTLISLISDANDEEEEGNRLRDKQIMQRQRILEQQQQALNLQRLENYELQDKAKKLQTLDKNTIDYKDSVKEITEYTGLSKEYIESLDGEALSKVVGKYGELKDKQLELNQAQENYNSLLKEREEIEDKTKSDDEDERKKAIADLEWMDKEESDYHKRLTKANDKVMSTQDEIKKKQTAINKERQKELDWQNKSTEAEKKKQKAIEASKKAEQERVALIAQTEKELADLDKFISDQSKRFNDVIANIDAEEQALTDMYDNALDSAMKYYGEDSEQVRQITALRIKALEELENKREEYRKANEKKATEEAREAEDAGRKVEDAKLKGRIARLEEGTAEYLDAVVKQDKLVEETELADLKRQYDDGIISKELYEAELDRIHAEHEQKRAELTKEYIKTVNEERQKNIEATWQGAEAIITQYGNLVNAAMEAELEAVKGNEEEEKEVRKRYAKQQFLQQIGGIAISTAKGIMEAWEAYAGIPYVGPALAAALSGIIGATGMAQTIAAKTAMNNALKAERGGILGGQSHANGGTMLSNGVEAERGEAIINKRSTATFAPLLSEINSYNGYGAPLIKSSQYGNGSLGVGVSDETIQKIVSATVAGVTSIPVVVSEHNITEAQRNVGVTRERSVL